MLLNLTKLKTYLNRSSLSKSTPILNTVNELNIYLISVAFGAKIEPLLPIQKLNHLLGTLRKGVDNCDAMNGILFVLRPSYQWNALNATGICTSSSVHRLFQEWPDGGVVERLWQNGVIY